jgi:DNA-binding transcriptional ArsR family regulator
MSLTDRDVRIERVLAVDPETAAAVGDGLRARLLELLAEETGTVAGLTEALSAAGEDRAEPTVRHHLRRLETAGLIEVARLESVGGGTRKHYRANTRLLPYTLPASAEADLERAGSAARRGTEALVDAVLDGYGEEITRVAAELDRPVEEVAAGDDRGPDPRVAFVVRELVNRALTDLENEGRL